MHADAYGVISNLLPAGKGSDNLLLQTDPRHRTTEPGRAFRQFSTAELQTSTAHLWTFHHTPMHRGTPAENFCFGVRIFFHMRSI